MDYTLLWPGEYLKKKYTRVGYKMSKIKHTTQKKKYTRVVE